MPKFKSIIDLLALFPTKQIIINHLERSRWGGNLPVSPFDPNSQVYKCANNWYKCKNTSKFFNVKTGTIFANTKIKLKKWFFALYLLINHKKGISSCQLAKDINITQKSAWYLLDNLRSSLKQSNFIKDMLENFVEIDETFLGGKNRNKHWNKKVPHSQGRSWKDKVPVLGMLERNSNLITKVVKNTQQSIIKPIINQNIKKGSDVYTDEWHAYKDLHHNFNHQIVNHSIKQYVNKNASTNAIENVWSHLKRSVYGTYHWVSKKHTQKYTDEAVFRYNTRKYSEHERFDLVLSSMVGKSLSCREAI